MDLESIFKCTSKLWNTPVQTHRSHQEVYHCDGTCSHFQRFYYKSNRKQNSSFKLVSPLTSMAMSCFFLLFFWKLLCPCDWPFIFCSYFPQKDWGKPNRGVKEPAKCNDNLVEWASLLFVLTLFLILIYLVCVRKKVVKSDTFLPIDEAIHKPVLITGNEITQ